MKLQAPTFEMEFNILILQNITAQILPIDKHTFSYHIKMNKNKNKLVQKVCILRYKNLLVLKQLIK